MYMYIYIYICVRSHFGSSGGESPPPPPPAKVASIDLDHHGPEHAAEESDPVVEEAGGDRKDGEPADAAEENANLTFSLDWTTRIWDW